MNCRFCSTALTNEFIDLVNSPASNSFLTKNQLNEPETFFPLKVYVCHNCFLVQIDEYKKSDLIFNSDYVYFSSFSKSWLNHAKAYVEMMIQRFKLDESTKVVEIASNDGYLLQYFKQSNVPVLGIEPTGNTAEVAIKLGIETIVDFFGVPLAKKLKEKRESPKLILGNNVLAHVPDIVDFVRGIKLLLRKDGVTTMEFPHLLQLIRLGQFDTIYHEHFSYLSFTVVSKIFEANGLTLFDVEEIPTHGGSLRIFGKHTENLGIPISANVKKLLLKETKEGIADISYYKGFENKAKKIKQDFVDFLITASRDDKKIIGYGAAAKGNTLLNWCGIKNDVIRFVVDANPSKQHKYLPGSHIPVVKEEMIRDCRPDYIIIFPWNIQEEVIEQLNYVREWGAKFVIPVPQLEIK